MISSRFKNFLLLIFLFTTTLVVVLQYIANKNIDALIAGNESLLREFQMKSRLKDLRSDLLALDNTIRRRVMQEASSRPGEVDESVARVKATVKELGDQIVTDSTRRLWDELNALSEQKIKFIYQVLDSLNSSGRPAAEHLLSQRSQEELNLAIGQISTNLDNSRQTYLTQITRQTDRDSLKAKRVQWVLGITAVLITIFAFWQIINHVRKQQEMIVQLNESEQKVREAAEIKSHFIANISHEIRTPINAILGFTGLLKKQPLEKLPATYVEAIDNSCDSLLHIMNDLLDFSKLESGMMIVETESFDLQLLLKSAYDMFAARAAEKKLMYSLDTAAVRNDIISSDVGRIKQVVANLLSNAIKFTEHGFVTITASTATDEGGDVLLTLTVEDSGIGIPEAQQAMIFERFTQAEENTTRKFGGTGLGLPIVKQLTGLLGGTIMLTSAPGKGSRFAVTIPCQPVVQQPETHTVSTEHGRPAIDDDFKILVVEDNSMNQLLMEHILKDWNIQYKIAGNGKEAIKCLQAEKFDLVLLDIQMPEMDGYTAARFIRQDMKSKVPIAAMTAHAFAGEEEKCFELGMNAYLSKPLMEKDLFKVISTYANLPAAEEPEAEPPQAKGVAMIDLSYLEGISNGDKAFERQMTEQFIQQVPQEMDAMHKAYELQDWQTVKRVAHSLKTSLSFLGLTPKVQVQLEYIESHSGENNVALNNAIHSLTNICRIALKEAAELVTA